MDDWSDTRFYALEAKDVFKGAGREGWHHAG